VIATYQFMSSGNSQTGVAYKKATIPLEVYSYLVSPVKEADFKLTLVSNLDFPALSEIFASFIQASAPNPEYYANPNALSFLLNDGAITTMIVAKNSSTKSLTADKIRIQGNDFDSLFLLMTELEQRMKQTSPNFKLEYKEELPFKDLFDVLTERKSIASNFLRVSEEMAEKTHELLLIQKRLLTRYKEKNNAALNNLDILLEASFNDLLAMSKESDKLQLLYRRNSQRVSISIRIILRLLKMSFPISEDGFQLLQMYLPVFVEPSVERIGWIEIMDLNIFYLLKNVLLGKEDSGAKEYAEVESVEVFKQHFVMLVNKLNQGLLANYKAPADEK
jgi:hypothetical protein